MQTISKVTIIGVGLIGGSIGLSLKRRHLCQRVTGVDEFSIIHRAMDRKIIDEGFDPTALDRAIVDAEIIFICTPIRQIMEILPGIIDLASPQTIICDVGSTKAKIVGQATQHLTGKHLYFLGSHPMAGSELNGVDAADAYLFENVVWVLTPYQKIPDTYIRKIGTLLESMGSKVLLLSPELHDKIAAGVSHLPQMIAIALTNLIGSYRPENPNYLRLAAGGFRDMTRIASSPYSIWKDICQTNSEQIAFFIDQFIGELSQLKDKLTGKGLEEDFEKANLTRMSIPKDSKGFLKAAYDISVGVEDKPGVIAGLATVLAEHDINIKDIEVLKIREGEGGTIRMAFISEENRNRAIQLIRDIGFTCHARD